MQKKQNSLKANMLVIFPLSISIKIVMMICHHNLPVFSKLCNFASIEMLNDYGETTFDIICYNPAHLWV